MMSSNQLGRPRVFIGSSYEALRTAEAIHANLSRDFHAEVWSQGIFKPSEGTLGSLAEFSADFDFAVVLVTPDDRALFRRPLPLRKPVAPAAWGNCLTDW